jgi:hypothetical protein
LLQAVISTGTAINEYFKNRVFSKMGAQSPYNAAKSPQNRNMDPLRRKKWAAQ